MHNITLLEQRRADLDRAHVFMGKNVSVRMITMAANVVFSGSGNFTTIATASTARSRSRWTSAPLDRKGPRWGPSFSCVMGRGTAGEI
jgi:hypothetical protein